MVLAATNNRRALDKALIRPGRFDKHFRVEPPDFKERKELIQMYGMNQKKTEALPVDQAVSLDELALWMEGWSCAKIESVLNEAALAARRQNMESLSKDILMWYCKKKQAGER